MRHDRRYNRNFPITRTSPMMTTKSAARRMPGVAEIIARVVAAACLGYSAWVHVDLHTNYSAVKTSTLSQGDLFLIQGVAASVAAVLVLFVGRLPGWTIAFLVSAASLAAILIYRYVDVGRLGPLPNMYEPAWFTEKTRSAIADGIAAGTSLIVLTILAVRPRTRRTTMPLPR
jgi:hypothetical protein